MNFEKVILAFSCSPQSAELNHHLGWPDVVGPSLTRGIGSTVSLLISELAFGAGSLRDEHAKVSVLAASLLVA